MKKLLTTSLIAISIATSAWAGGIDTGPDTAPVTNNEVAAPSVTPQAMPVQQADPRSDWTFYVGAVVGGGFGDSRFNTVSNLTIANIIQPEATLAFRDQTIYGILGINAGFLYQLTEMFFTGFEVEGNLDGMKLRAAYDDPNRIGNFGTYNYELSRKYQVIASALLGYNFTSSSSVYAKFGVGITGFELSEISDGITKRSTTGISFVPAIGVSTDLSDNLAARLELSSEFFTKDIQNNFQSDQAQPTRFTANTTAKFSNFAMKISVLWKM